jgi:iron complex outermembrane receptor protein
MYGLPGVSKGDMPVKPKAMSRLFVLIIVIIILPAIDGGLWSQEKEDLLFQEIPVVVTASRKEQPITEAPTTITVITSDDIRYSGATNIPDILRMVAGVDVMTITARDQQVGIRGFITPINNKLLVLVDGRTVYTDLYGAVFWEIFPVGVAEIDRIEVVKSPASSIYGANAFSGVVNIITKSPKQLKGTTLHLTAGGQNTLIGSILHAGEIAEKLNYKISAEWDRTNGWSEIQPGENPGEVMRVNALLEYVLGDKGRFVFSGGRGYSKNKKLLSGEYLGTGKVNDTIDYFQVDFQYSNLKFRTFYKSEKPGVDWILTGERHAWHTATFNAELLHTFAVGKNQSLVWGLNYRYNTLEKNPFILQNQFQHLWALFFEDEIKITKKLRLTLGGRYDRHPLAGEHFSPRGNISFSPTKKHIIRLSVAKAFRNPTFVDSYLYIEEQLNIGLNPPLPQIDIPYRFIYQGNQGLKPEGITAYEIGYHSNWTEHIKLDLNLFYNRYNDFISPLRMVTFYGENEIFPGSPGGLFPRVIVSSFENRGKTRGIGGELNLDFSICDGISGFVNYSFLEITDEEDEPSTIEINEKNRVRPENPKHKLNSGLRFIFKNGISLNLLAHWVDKTQKIVRDINGNTYLAFVDDYFIFNTTVGYTFWKKKVQLALSIFNLFNHKHYEYPLDTSSPIPSSARTGRRVTVTLRIKF